ncbi:ferritin-like domain-containing protein [Nocardioides sp.]|uniref:ferritin-like domain-containing protein n=1 Tax=Nocardioides sp. TaxID=35761 RepID=UPI0031FEECB3|nr:hypothetical protein [Nocardioides sp.]
MSALGALQKTLGAEHAAVYVCGALGAQTSQTRSRPLYDALTAAYTAHRARRDQLVQEISARGAEPVSSAPAYELPERLDTEPAVARTALDLERSCATTYAFLVANIRGTWRRWAIGALTESAVRELAFRGTPEMFPGADEYADR